MREWILNNDIATEIELKNIELLSKQEVKSAKNDAWKTYSNPILNSRNSLMTILSVLNDDFKTLNFSRYINEPSKKDIISTARKVLYSLNKVTLNSKIELIDWLKLNIHKNTLDYSSHLYSQSKFSPLKI